MCKLASLEGSRTIYAEPTSKVTEPAPPIAHGASEADARGDLLNARAEVTQLREMAASLSEGRAARAAPVPIQKPARTGLPDRLKTGGASTIQRLRKGGAPVDIGLLSDADLLRLINAEARPGNAEGVGAERVVDDYLFEDGDFHALSLEYRKRHPHGTGPAGGAAAPTAHLEDAAELMEEYGSDGSDEGSDFVPDEEDELEAELATGGRFRASLDAIKYDDEGEEKELKPWSEKSLVGAMGEIEARTAMSGAGRTPVDLNAVRLNMSGVDNVSDDPSHPFEQTKMHLAPSTANPETYLRHLANSGYYAIKGVRALYKSRARFEEAIAEEGIDGSFAAFLAALDKLEGTSDDDIEGSAAHHIVVAGMCFSVPSDIYDQIPVAERKSFRRMGHDVAYYRRIMERMEGDFTPAKPSGSKRKEEEEDYIPSGAGGASSSSSSSSSSAAASSYKKHAPADSDEEEDEDMGH